MILKVGLNAVVLKDRVDLHLRPDLRTIGVAQADHVNLVRREFEDAFVGNFANRLHHTRKDRDIGYLRSEPHRRRLTPSADTAQLRVQSLTCRVCVVHMSLNLCLQAAKLICSRMLLCMGQAWPPTNCLRFCVRPVLVKLLSRRAAQKKRSYIGESWIRDLITNV